MNSVIDLLMNHRSIRKFKPEPLAPEQKKAILGAAQMASTSSNVQAYSIISVTDPLLKKELAEFAGNQAYVEQCGLFLVFCADLSRLRNVTENCGEIFHQNTESFLVASLDAALAAQNAAIAAESLGLGICYIGGIRNVPHKVSEALRLPELVYPVFGMCIGVPDQEPSLRPRLPMQAVVHENAYDTGAVLEGIQEYDETTRRYYRERTGGQTDLSWSRSMADKYRLPVRPHIKPFVESKGFKLD
ncbi:oxygen-insensitive NADPH nitroreductase [Paenibacillus lutrae]|uniref:Oxygen-insensitive NADPH nitroreductase n=1 Tax=Paenibacillus lutrae TaxID=2078573 RepID=A0A7X3FLL1_9BACL|nr:oxygen-insensitive NADPH nitroreductase [Paenibacillus lutrae]MVP01951.1 oxygen-insensitive NADPH nitroreductase [Paenibacillus lutrae]